jgi:hypothetical protein
MRGIKMGRQVEIYATKRSPSNQVHEHQYIEKMEEVCEDMLCLPLAPSVQ